MLCGALALSVAACGGSDKEANSSTPDAQATAPGKKLTVISPLTGLTSTKPLPRRRVTVVKIDNTSSSAPQVGLSSADILFEELVEGGITRLAAMFYSTLPSTVGPVRSARTSDIGVVRPVKAALVASGAATYTKVQLRGANVSFFEEGAPGYFRDRSRSAPYNLFIRLPEFVKSLGSDVTPPANYLPWGKASDFVGALPATKISARFSPRSTTRFQYSKSADKYVSTNGFASVKDRFRADSVLVLRVKETLAPYRDPAGNPVPETLFFGTGDMVLFHGGQAVRGTWSKPDRSGALTLSTPAGPVKVPAGKTWIELLPEDGAGGRLSFAG